jgi:3-dehydrotetronate 4-kinase
MSMRLGVIADDFTGATDVANNLVRAGMRVVQTIGVPTQPVGEVDAVVVALKSRTAPVAQAVGESLAAAQWLREQGAAQLYFKVCSTFDSTAQGNIGPVAEALQAFTQAAFVPVTPAFPEAGRTVFKGHLFVGDVLLSDSPMRDHPLTPMRDANLVRVLQAQLARARVGLIDHTVVARGGPAIAVKANALAGAGMGFGIVDTVDNAALHHLAQACADWPLVVAGSGLGIGLAPQWGFQPQAAAAALPPAQGHAAVVSGSCSAASNAQVLDFLTHGGEGFAVDPLRLAAHEDLAAAALAWAAPRLGQGPVLIYATAAPDAVRAVQARLGVDAAGLLVEQTLAAVASGLVALGVKRLVVAGGETSGACVQALCVRQMRIGPQIDPGVPWCHAAQPGLHLALKSGNFGGADFFRRAFDVLDQCAAP